MKNQFFKNSVLLLALLVGVALTNVAWATNELGEYKKEISKEFPISADGEVTIVGKYGNINVTTWNQNKVKFDVTIEVKASSKTKADKLMEKLQIEFNNSKSSVEAIFKKDDIKNWREYKNTSYKIHYEVKLPAGNSLDLTNKYGNINVVDINGKAQIINKYGNIKMGDIGGNVELDLGYGKADLGSITGNIDIEIKYSKVDIESVKDINISSKYSKMYIDNAGNMKSESKYDKFYLGTIGNLKTIGKYDDFEIKSVKDINATGKYSDYDIEEMTGSGSFDMGYGDAIIKKVNASFGGVEFTGKHADLKIDLKGAGANYNILGNYTKVKLPSNVNRGNYFKEKNEIKTDGSINGGGKMIKASAKYGSVVIYE